MLSGAPLNDQTLKMLAEKIAAGDQSAFRLLFDNFAHKLTDFANSILRSKEAATEVVDDVLVKIWRNKEKLPDVGNLRVYLYTATKNTSLNYLSKKANRAITKPFDDIDVEISDDYSPEAQLITKEIHQKIQQATEALPPRCKMIFKLVREDGLKYKEVAEILHLSINTVDAQMVIAVKRISEAVGPYITRFPGIPKHTRENYEK